ECAKNQGPRLHSECLRVLGIVPQRALQVLERPPGFFLGALRGVMEGADNALPGAQIWGRLAADPRVFRRQDFGIETSNDTGRDLILDREDILQTTFVAVGPEMMAAIGLQQL